MNNVNVCPKSNCNMPLSGRNALLYLFLTYIVGGVSLVGGVSYHGGITVGGPSADEKLIVKFVSPIQSPIQIVPDDSKDKEEIARTRARMSKQRSTW